MILGIDIGTSYSSAAVLENGRAVPIKPGKETLYSIPSAAYVADGKLLIGRMAEINRRKDPSGFKANFKKDFGTNEPYILGEAEITPEQIYSEYFKFFKVSAEQFSGEKVQKAYITHPAQYGEEKIELLKRSAQYAGLFDVEFLPEPVAAGMSFFSERVLDQGETLLVYDFGGGTFDTALLKMEKRGLRLLGQPMGMACGGTTFDRMLYQEIIKRMPQEEEIRQAVKRPKFKWLVMEQVVETKHLLSASDIAVINIPVGYGEFMEYTITRQEFTKMIQDKVEESITIIKNMLKNINIEIEEIDKILCVGGTSRIPYITERLECFAGKPVLKSVDPELAVCCGAVLGENKNIEKQVSVIKGSADIEETEENCILKHSENKEKVHDDAQRKRAREIYNEAWRSYHGWGVTVDKKKAFQLFYTAGEAGLESAEYRVGFMYEYGIGTNQNFEEAKLWYKRSAEHGYDMAKSAAEKIKKKTKNSSAEKKISAEEECNVKKIYLSKKEAEKSYQDGWRYYHGWGVTVNKKEAFALFLNAAVNGLEKAEYRVGFMHEYGIGTSQDYEKAKIWYQKAKEHGYDMARKALEDINRKLIKNREK